MNEQNTYLFNIWRTIEELEELVLQGIDAQTIAKKLNVPVEWVHVVEDDLLNFAEGRSQLWTTTEREGLAFKSNCG